MALRATSHPANVLDGRKGQNLVRPMPVIRDQVHRSFDQAYGLARGSASSAHDDRKGILLNSISELCDG